MEYHKCQISNVILETAGTVDLDVEIKFIIASEIYSIDVHKKHLIEGTPQKAFDWLSEKKKEFSPKDFNFVFDTFIQQ